MVGLAPGLGTVTGSHRTLTHCAGHVSRGRLVWECLLLLVLLKMALGGGRIL